MDRQNTLDNLGLNIEKATRDLRTLSGLPPTDGQVREIITEMRNYTRDLERVLQQPERLVGCECAIHESHAGKCSGADCYCH